MSTIMFIFDADNPLDKENNHLTDKYKTYKQKHIPHFQIWNRTF